MSSEMSSHLIRLAGSFAIVFSTILFVTTTLWFIDPFGNSLMMTAFGELLFWPTVFLDKVSPADPDYFDLWKVPVSLFVSMGVYSLVLSFVLWCLANIKAR